MEEQYAHIAKKYARRLCEEEGHAGQKVMGRAGPQNLMLGSLVRKHASVFTSASFRGPISLLSGRFMSATSDAPAATEEPEKPKRVSQMPPMKLRLEQERLYKDVRKHTLLSY